MLLCTLTFKLALRNFAISNLHNAISKSHKLGCAIWKLRKLDCAISKLVSNFASFNLRNAILKFLKFSNCTVHVHMYIVHGGRLVISVGLAQALPNKQNTM